VELWGDEIESIQEFDPLTGEVMRTLQEFDLYPANQYVTTKGKLEGRSPHQKGARRTCGLL
jgi:excinuclease ABC subunit B